MPVARALTLRLPFIRRRQHRGRPAIFPLWPLLLCRCCLPRRPQQQSSAGGLIYTASCLRSMPNIHLRRDIPPVRAWLMAPPFDDGDVSLSFSRLLDFLGAIESGFPHMHVGLLRERACLFMRSWYVGCCHVAAPQRELPVPRGCVTTTDFTKIKEEHTREGRWRLSSCWPRRRASLRLCWAGAPPAASGRCRAPAATSATAREGVFVGGRARPRHDTLRVAHVRRA